MLTNAAAPPGACRECIWSRSLPLIPRTVSTSSLAGDARIGKNLARPHESSHRKQKTAAADSATGSAFPCIPDSNRGRPMTKTTHWLAYILLLVTPMIAWGADWPAWRGPSGIGVSTEVDLPTKWSPTENVRWRIALPEAGNSTPIVWGQRVYVTQAVKEQRTLMCFDRAEGKLLWQEGVKTGEKEPTHGTNPYCSASPVTDGERVIASYASDGLYCYDFEGKVLWKRTDLGQQ